MPGKRRFGRVRELPSGRWQARYKGPDGIDRPAPRTFESKTSAERWLTLTEAEIIQATGSTPTRAGAVRQLCPRLDRGTAGPAAQDDRVCTGTCCAATSARHSALGLADIRSRTCAGGGRTCSTPRVSAVTVAKAYRLLKAIFNTAVDDGLIRRNPCRIKGAGQEKSPERPVLTVPQVYALADAVGGRYRALVLLGVFASLRWGELAALRRADIDLQARTVRVSRQLSEQRGGGFAFGPPKSDAGHRIVAIPSVITPDLASHIVTFAAPGDDGLVFTSSAGRPLRRSNFCRRDWHPALRAAGLPPIHFHDLRHTGNQLAADEGANLRELMDRMGHRSTLAALIYLHRQ